MKPAAKQEGVKEEEVVNIREKEERMEYRPQETAYLESTIGVPDQQQSRSLVPDTRYPASVWPVIN